MRTSTTTSGGKAGCPANVVAEESEAGGPAGTRKRLRQAVSAPGWPRRSRHASCRCAARRRVRHAALAIRAAGFFAKTTLFLIAGRCADGACACRWKALPWIDPSRTGEGAGQPEPDPFAPADGTAPAGADPRQLPHCPAPATTPMPCRADQRRRNPRRKWAWMIPRRSAPRSASKPRGGLIHCVSSAALCGGRGLAGPHRRHRGRRPSDTGRKVFIEGYLAARGFAPPVTSPSRPIQA
jgi:hypothetical protein